MFTADRIQLPGETTSAPERRDDYKSRARRSRFVGLRRGDRVLARTEEPPLGAHLVTPRFAYAHHGVYVGAGSVVHYGALEYHWPRRPVEEVSLARFARGHPIWVRPAGPDRLQSEEVIRRARSRLGEDRYRLLSNNCEHFSEWCVHGQHRSAQVERLVALPRRLGRVFRSVVRRIFDSPCGTATMFCAAWPRLRAAGR